MMNELQVIEMQGQRVLTTKQIAEAYETDVKTVQYNFRYNKARYQIGKHYIEITGKELQEMKRRSEIPSPFTKQVKHLYLWTEKGALLHAKSLNTDKAWEVYDYLVDFYFRVKENKEITKPTGREVVDIPENVDIQKAIQDVKKYLIATEVLIDSYNRYLSEENCFHIRRCINTLSVDLQCKILNLMESKPNIVVK